MNPLDSLGSTPQCILAARATLGECPRWHSAEQRLYWVDIAANSMYRWTPATGQQDERRFDAPVGCFAFRERGGFILGMKNGCALIDSWDGAPRPFGDQVLTGKPHHRMNDGRTDAAGRLWIGSINAAKDVEDAMLYRLDRDGTLTAIEGGMTTCNGAAFTSDGYRFAHSDTPSHAVRVYDCDTAAGALSNRRILHQLATGVGPGLGRPDGGSFDMDGCYWVAMFDGWRIVRLSPAGDVVAEVALPVQRPTMISFGGPDHRTAFVTTATTGLDGDALNEQPDAGGVFAFRADVPGVRETAFAG